MKAVIFANADITDYGMCLEYLPDAVVICCDGGMRHARVLGIMPDYIVGDFDSVDKDTFEFYKNKNIDLKQVPCRKDETDTELGVIHALEIGADDITIFGAMGSRMDHTLANIFLLVRIDKVGKKGRLVNENNVVILATSKTEIYGEKGDIVSFIPLTYTVTGVTTKGLEYPLNNETLYIDSPRGVSNIMTDTCAEYSFDEGFAIIIKALD